MVTRTMANALSSGLSEPFRSPAFQLSTARQHRNRMSDFERLIRNAERVLGPDAVGRLQRATDAAANEHGRKEPEIRELLDVKEADFDPSRALAMLHLAMEDGQQSTPGHQGAGHGQENPVTGGLQANPPTVGSEPKPGARRKKRSRVKSGEPATAPAQTKLPESKSPRPETRIAGRSESVVARPVEVNVDRGRMTSAGSSSERLIQQAIRGEYLYSMLGLVLGMATIIGGIVLGLHGVGGSTSWTAKVLGLQSQINDAAPGVVLFIVGVFYIWMTRPKVKLRDLKG
jgi:hypothetical protein